MAATSRKSENARRRLAAYNFLSNISLDGTHRDTKYKIFNKRGLYNSTDRGSSGKRSQKTSINITSRETTDPSQKDVGDIHELVSKTTQTAKENDEPQEIKEKLSPVGSYNRGRSISLSEETPSERLSLCEEEDKVPDGQRRYSSLFPMSRRRTCSSSEDDSISTQPTPTVRERLSSLSSRIRLRSTSSSLSSVSASTGAGRVTVTSRPLVHSKLPHTPNSRVILLSPRRAPFMVYSSLPYVKKPGAKEGVENANKRCPSHTHLPAHPDSLLSHTVTEGDGQDRSYGHLLVPSRHRHAMKKMPSVDSGAGLLYPIVEASHTSQSSPVEFDASGSVMYNPNLLDDPELRSGKHRTLMTFPSYMTSVIDYVRPSDLKSELNEKFRERFPNVQLTLSKLRSLKHDLYKIARSKCGLEVLIIAEAYVFFEKIILKGLINKPNRKMVAGACLMLAAKLNDVKGSDLSKLIEETEDTFKLHRKDLLAIEFGVLLGLEFGLHVPDSEINPHYQRLLYNS